ncbi:hypothetical protein FRC18_007645 [Serendipita sp. 400]|nr:hypothetical protein FRC18_007645 [Serendipita sp. 400]
MIKKWTESHIGDYTAMQYLCQLYSLMEAHGIQHIQIHSDTGEVVGENSTNVENKSPFSPIAHSIELVRRFPTHEALWYYLRAAYAPQLCLGKSRPNIEELKGLDEEKLKSFERWVSGLKQTIT